MVPLQHSQLSSFFKVNRLSVVLFDRLQEQFLFSGDTATCLYNAPHEDDSLPRVLPGKLLSLDAQCRRDRGTSACFVSIYRKNFKLTLIGILFNFRKTIECVLNCFVSILAVATV